MPARRLGRALFDQQEAARQAERDAVEEQRRGQAAAKVVAARQRAEEDLRRSGVAEADVPRLADAVMDSWCVDQARQAAERGPANEAELRGFFRRRAAAAGRAD